ncbi:hypothetical protein HDU87_007761 [Geranomyces variabilis]|uniref:SEC7 domain-containing protein n=1 Tax=Geranomyces variabilis TaxID=109894 RepID=A0AAD5XJG7_9FUNG|nr:hypothetical protein HDU87_007761 [Geranomyces variabilis]
MADGARLAVDVNSSHSEYSEAKVAASKQQQQQLSANDPLPPPPLYALPPLQTVPTDGVTLSQPYSFASSSFSPVSPQSQRQSQSLPPSHSPLVQSPLHSPPPPAHSSDPANPFRHPTPLKLPAPVTSPLRAVSWSPNAPTRNSRFLTLDVGKPLSIDIPPWLLSDMEKSTADAATGSRDRRIAANTDGKGRPRSLSVPSNRSLPLSGSGESADEKSNHDGTSPTPSSSPDSGNVVSGARLARSRSAPAKRSDMGGDSDSLSSREEHAAKAPISEPKTSRHSDEPLASTPRHFFADSPVLASPPISLAALEASPSKNRRSRRSSAQSANGSPKLPALHHEPTKSPIEGLGSPDSDSASLQGHVSHAETEEGELVHQAPHAADIRESDRHAAEPSDPKKGKFWTGIKRSVSDNIAKLRPSRSTLDFRNLPASRIDVKSPQVANFAVPRMRDISQEPENPETDPLRIQTSSSSSHREPRSGTNSPGGLAALPPAPLSKRTSVSSLSSAIGRASPAVSYTDRRPSRSGASVNMPHPYSLPPLSPHASAPRPLLTTGSGETSPHISPESCDDLEPEQFAQLLKDHKEANLDKATGAVSIPKRSSSYIGSQPASAIGDAGGEPSSPTHSSSRGTPIGSPNPRSSSVSPIVLSAIPLAETPDRTNTDSEGLRHSRPPLPPFEETEQRIVLERTTWVANDAVRSTTGTLDLGLTADPASGGAEVRSTQSIPPGTYKEMDPVLVGQLLWKEALPEITYDRISEVIGKGNDFSRAILASYMDCFDFGNQEIDEAFRTLASHLLVTGESQVLSRIFDSFARKWWECNPQAWHVYLGWDIVEGIINSVMMLNTDHHVANSVARGKRIPKKRWVTNTLDHLTEMARKNKWIDTSPEGKDPARIWGRDMEGILRRVFDRTAKSPLPQRQVPKISLDSSGNESVSPEYQSPSSPGYSLHTPRMHRDASSLSLASTLSTGTMFSVADSSTGAKRRALHSLGFRRKEERHTDSRLSFHESFSNPHTRSLDSQLNLTNSITPADTLTIGRHSVNGVPSKQQDKLMTSSDPSPLSPRKQRSIPRAPSTGEIQIEGQLIRKHLTDANDVKAKHRQWIKTECALKLDQQAGTLELVMEKLEKDTTGFAAENESIPMSRTGTGDSLGTRSMHGDRGRTGAERPLPRLREPLPSFNLLHSLATPLPPPGHSAMRPHVFTLRLSEGSIYLFHGINAEVVKDWVRTINIWAARKSKEPLTGSGGNAEYGWGLLSWDRAQRQERDRLERNLALSESMVPRPGSAPSSAVFNPVAGTLSPLNAGGPKYAASMRSFASAASVDSGRSAVTVSGTTSAGSSGSKIEADKELAKRLKRQKLLDWLPPVPLGKIMSNLPEAQQQRVWERQQELVLREIEEHSGYRDGLDKLYAGHPNLKQKAQANWQRKQRWLMREYEKYCTYGQLLAESVAVAAAVVLAGDAAETADLEKPLPASPLQRTLSKNRRWSIGPASGYSPDRDATLDHPLTSPTRQASSPQSALSAATIATSPPAAAANMASPSLCNLPPFKPNAGASKPPLPPASPPASPEEKSRATGSLDVIRETASDDSNGPAVKMGGSGGDTVSLSDNESMASETRPRARRGSLGSLLSSSPSKRAPSTPVNFRYLPPPAPSGRTSKDSERSFRTAETGDSAEV